MIDRQQKICIQSQCMHCGETNEQLISSSAFPKDKETLGDAFNAV